MLVQNRKQKANKNKININFKKGDEKCLNIWNNQLPREFEH